MGAGSRNAGVSDRDDSDGDCNGPRTTSDRTAHNRNLPGGMSVSRADVADGLLRAASDPGDAQQAVGIAR
ncbi:hypothetical protein [Frankia sp. R82]|uniref:hypothetical protein n=1 Tax=Frankia sp. R82 TaxID=2950553 RepID=UPI0020449B9D|nr:hypothetical protein [Frankia sp. R82]MCM3887329.1 hypothetical protein [Frankia sp. R82]